MLLLSLWACIQQAEVRDWDCGDEECPTCESESDCEVVHDGCSEVAYCAHSSVGPAGSAIPAICEAPGYGEPPPWTCQCVESRCRSAE